ncbi:MAG: hypothetical protein ACK5NK_05360 [Niabella sp.]
MLTYIFQMLLCSAIMYGYYYFFLRNNKFHQYNRFYLLSAVVLSIVLPLVKVPVIFKEDDGIIYQSLDSLNIVITAVAHQEKQITASTLLYILYTIIVLLFIIRIMVAVLEQSHSIRQPQGQTGFSS